MRDKFIIFRWIILIPAAFVGAYIAVFAGALIEYTGLRIHHGIFGAIISSSFIVTGTYIVPSYKLFTAPILFIIGVIISWDFLSSRTKIDSVTPDYIPMISTYCSGILACGLIFYWIKRERK